MTGEELGRRSLAADAAYCAGAATLTLLARGPLARMLAVPTLAIALPAVGTFAWAALVAKLARRPSWRPAVGTVAVANLGASALLLTAAARRREGRLLLAATALEVGGFAASQVAALRRPRSSE